MFRIQKILLADYQEIYEPVLVENPFAEVTEGGIGIRQVQLGLTPTKILIGADIFDRPSSDGCGCCMSYLSIFEKDPEIECFELVTVLPLEILNVSFFKKNMRMIMNVKISEAKNMFFEFGGYLSQNLFWNTWRERIATLKQIGPNLFHLTGSSPFSSTDVIPDEEEITASTHPKPLSNNSLSNEKSTINFPLKRVSSYYKQLSSKYTDIIERTSTLSLSSDSEHQHQMELQNYYQSLSITNSFSCGCNTSW